MKVIYSIGVKFAGGGIGDTAYHAVSGIYKYGHLKRVIVLGADKTEISEDRIINISLPLKPPLPSKYYNLFKDWYFDKMTTKYIDKCNIFHGWNGQCLSSLKKAKKLGAKTIVERASSHILYQNKLLVDEYKKHGIHAKPILDYVLKKSVKEYDVADYVTVPSDFVYNSFIEQGFDENKLIKIPFGVDTDKFKPGNKKDDIFRVLFVGQIRLRKGFQYLLEAWEELDLKDAELVLVGGILREARELMDTYKNSKNFKLMGFVQDVVKIYQNSSIFVFPSVEEGSALVSYEAMACGLPVIVTTNTGSVARDGEDGFVIPIRDVKAIKEKIQYFYDNPEEIKRMGRNAREYIEKYTWERYGDGLVKAYEKVI